jgi:ribose-phosphate pyrophosphokinase
MDLHKAQIQGFFDIPVDHLFAAPVIIDHLARMTFPNLTIVAPDAGGAERARAYAKRLGGELAVIDKRRSDDGTAEVMNVVGDVAGGRASSRTTSSTRRHDREGGQRAERQWRGRDFACAVHGVLSGTAFERSRRRRSRS